MTIEPGNKIQRVARRFRVEFQGVMALGIFDHLPLRRRQPLEVGERSCIIDDPILTRQHQQGRLTDAGGRPRDQAVDDEAGGQQPGGPLPQAERVGGDERLALRVVREERGSDSGIGKVFRRFVKNAQAISRRSLRETPTRG